MVRLVSSAIGEPQKSAIKIRDGGAPPIGEHSREERETHRAVSRRSPRDPRPITPRAWAPTFFPPRSLAPDDFFSIIDGQRRRPLFHRKFSFPTSPTFYIIFARGWNAEFLLLIFGNQRFSGMNVGRTLKFVFRVERRKNVESFTLYVND